MGDARRLGSTYRRPFRWRGAKPYTPSGIMEKDGTAATFDDCSYTFHLDLYRMGDSTVLWILNEVTRTDWFRLVLRATNVYFNALNGEAKHNVEWSPPTIATFTTSWDTRRSWWISPRLIWASTCHNVNYCKTRSNKTFPDWRLVYRLWPTWPKLYGIFYCDDDNAERNAKKLPLETYLHLCIIPDDMIHDLTHKVEPLWKEYIGLMSM
jgi:hypothetical protein